MMFNKDEMKCFDSEEEQYIKEKKKRNGYLITPCCNINFCMLPIKYFQPVYIGVSICAIG